VTAPRLEFDRSPPLWAPLRFLLTAPAFGIAAALLLVWAGPDALQSRWTPQLLAITHLMTLGFLAMVMIGALLQVLPVVAGTAVGAPRLTSGLVHPLLILGTVCLATGFWIGSPVLLQLASGVLVPVLGWAIVAIGWGLWRSRTDHAMISVARLALFSLAITVVLGAILAIALARGWPLSIVALTDLHLQWGLIGWIGLLVAAVAMQVVPMFQTTPAYPQKGVRWLARLVFAALVVATPIALSTSLPSIVRSTALLFVALAAATFAAYTLHLQYRRRRRQPDTTTMLWTTGMLCVLLAALAFAAATVQPAIAGAGFYDIALGVLMIFGFATSVVNGMLYKVVPFLLWLHMQEQARTPAGVPHLHRILQRSRQRLQSRIHLAALALLLLSTVWPEGLVRIAGLAAALSFALLWWNLLSALRVYRGFITTGASEHTSHLCAQAAPSNARSAAGSSIAQRRLSRSTPIVSMRPAVPRGTS
jgi:hypothetical protein